MSRASRGGPGAVDDRPDQPQRRDLAEFERFARAVDVPILANMTEFGRSELFTTRQLADAGVPPRPTVISWSPRRGW
ncbi:hypothetical protein [Nocardioides sp.]|uniref:hypothetical protein n=1 Tax=Nocardioides sp. TaxID=35761 RepID=UPI0039E43E2E